MSDPSCCYFFQPNLEQSYVITFFSQTLNSRMSAYTLEEQRITTQLQSKKTTYLKSREEHPGIRLNVQWGSKYRTFKLRNHQINSSLQHNILRSFCCVLVLWNLYIIAFFFSRDVIAKEKEISCAYFCFCSNTMCFRLLHIL